MNSILARGGAGAYARWLVLVAGGAFAVFGAATVVHAQARADAGAAAEASGSADEPAQQDEFAADEDAAAEDEYELEIYDDPDEDEYLDEDEDPGTGDVDGTNADPGTGMDEGPVADADEEQRTMRRFLGGAGTSIEDADGFLRPPARLPTIGRASGRPAGDGVDGSASLGEAGGTTGMGEAHAGAGSGSASGTATASGATAAKPTKPTGRIFGGSVAREGVPWQAQLYAPFPMERWSEASRKGREPWEVRHYCGGSLIAPEWVLTAAHCLYDGMAEKGFRIRLGVRDISRDEGVSYPIDKIVFHPGWNEKKSMYLNDIALVRIATNKPIRGAAIDPKRPPDYSPISLHRGPAPGDRQPVRATGWGKTRDVELDKGSSALLQVEMNVLAEPRCAALPGYGPSKIHSGVVCASAPGRQTCRGDSGGPIVFRDGAPVLVGVVSWGKERCTGDDQPGVYTRVGAYVPWIDSVIRANAR
jgi:hypothetical protein